MKIRARTYVFCPKRNFLSKWVFMRAKHDDGKSKCSCYKRQNLSDLLLAAIRYRRHNSMALSDGWKCRLLLLLLLYCRNTIDDVHTAVDCVAVLVHIFHPKKNKASQSSNNGKANTHTNLEKGLACWRGYPENWRHNVFHVHRGCWLLLCTAIANGCIARVFHTECTSEEFPIQMYPAYNGEWFGWPQCANQQACALPLEHVRVSQSHTKRSIKFVDTSERYVCRNILAHSAQTLSILETV